MPVQLVKAPDGVLGTMKNIAFESQAVAWLLYDGWQVFRPVLDNGHKTDILISDGVQYYRIQIKTVSARRKDIQVGNQWEGYSIDYVIYFARDGYWGYIAPAFSEKTRPLKHPEHKFFHLKRRSFLNAFHEMG